jgi:hypothetical protein
MITLCFAASGRLILDALSKGSKYNQDDFIHNRLPALNQVRTGDARHNVAPTLMVHIDNSIDHNGAKITEKTSVKRSGEHFI